MNWAFNLLLPDRRSRQRWRPLIYHIERWKMSLPVGCTSKENAFHAKISSWTKSTHFSTIHRSNRICAPNRLSVHQFRQDIEPKTVSATICIRWEVRGALPVFPWNDCCRRPIRMASGTLERCLSMVREFERSNWLTTSDEPHFQVHRWRMLGPFQGNCWQTLIDNTRTLICCSCNSASW